LHDQIDWEVLRKFKLAGDQYLWSRFARKAELHIVPEFIGSHRSHGNQLSHQFRKEYFTEYAELTGKKSSLWARLSDWHPQVLWDKARWLMPDGMKRIMAGHYLKIR
jgi:hypothetical protein